MNISTMVKLRARAVALKAVDRAEVTAVSPSASSDFGSTWEMAPVMPTTVPRKPRMGMAQVMNRSSE